MNKKIIKTASVIAVGAGAAALYKAKFAKDNDSDSGSCGCKNSNGKGADKKSMSDRVIEKWCQYVDDSDGKIKSKNRGNATDNYEKSDYQNTERGKYDKNSKGIYYASGKIGRASCRERV